MELKDKDELAFDLGNRLLDDADNIRLFMPDHYGKFWFKWRGHHFNVELCMDPDKDKEADA